MSRKRRDRRRTPPPAVRAGGRSPWGRIARHETGLVLPAEIARQVSVLAGYGGFSASEIFHHLKPKRIAAAVALADFARYVGVIQREADLLDGGQVDPRREAIVTLIIRMVARRMGDRRFAEFKAVLADSAATAAVDVYGGEWADDSEFIPARSAFRDVPDAVLRLMALAIHARWAAVPHLYGALGLHCFGVRERALRYWAPRVRRAFNAKRAGRPELQATTLARVFLDYLATLEPALAGRVRVRVDERLTPPAAGLEAAA